MSLHRNCLILVLALPALLACTAPAKAGELESASILLERNVTDGDAEAVIEVEGGDDGLSSLLVIAPDGRRVARYESRNRRNLGARELLLESPEPGVDEVLAAYPEGVYRFVGTTFDGEELRGEAELVHHFPDPVAITSPPADGTVPAAGLVIAWEPVAGAVGYFLELEDEEAELVLAVDLPAGVTTFSPPPGWLHPGTEYVLGLASRGEEGNITFVETAFTTEE